MKIKLIAYGIAKDLMSGKTLELDIPEGSSIGNLKDKLIEHYPGFSNLRSLNFAVGVEYRDDSFVLNDGTEVVIIPPVAGG